MTENLSTWLRDRPVWLQEAARMLLEKGRLADDDIDSLLNTCLKEASSDDMSAVASISVNTRSHQGASAVALCSIGNVKGVNALAPRAPLDFGSGNLAIVFGGNGSGKSGYVRILKHLCGARNQGKLHPNVFEEGNSDQSVDVKYRIGESEHEITWRKANGIHQELRLVDIFDTDCGRMYLEGESEVSYEPPALLFFSDLIAICSLIIKLVNEKLEMCTSGKPHLPSGFINTKSGKWYASLCSSILPEQVEFRSKWEDVDNTIVAGLERRLAGKAPAERAREHLQKQNHAERIIRSIEDSLTDLSDENCQNILHLRLDMNAKHEAAQVAASKVFSDTPLQGIGSSTWKLLWEHARRFSEEEAYCGQSFPHLASETRCVLCQQPLSDEAQKRFVSFEEFVKGQAERDARIAAKAFEEAVGAIGDILTDEEIVTKCDAAGLAFDKESTRAISILNVLQQRKAKLLEVASIDELPDIPDVDSWLAEVRKIALDNANAVKESIEDSASDTRPQLEKQLCEFKARKWLNEHRESIRVEIERLVKVEQFEKAKRLSDTRVLSRKKGELAEALITDAFVLRFQNELLALGASGLQVELVKKRVERGHVLHELRLTNAHGGLPHEVFSEGEHRIVSLAAFLADVTGKEQPAPFIFDDPISSLDQDFEEAVVKRLVDLAAERQVIVFTHRISLLVLLQDFSKRVELSSKVICVRTEAWGTGEPGDTPLFAKKPDRALKALINQNLAKARKIRDEVGQEAYEPHAKAICRDFRILLERMIECVLLNDVVQRFRRSVNTLGKLDRIAQVTPEDCKLFDDFMTKYSRFEHSQPASAPVALPDPMELKTDMELLRDWRNEFVGRTR